MANFTGSKIGSISEIDFRNMRAFRKIVDSGGISLAAECYGQEKSTFSRALKTLEDRLDAELCLRGPRGFTLTEYGKAVYSASVYLDDALVKARTEINGSREKVSGQLRLGISDNLISNMDAKLSDSLEIFFRTAPDVEVEVSISPPNQLAEALKERRVDIAIIAEKQLDPLFHMTPLFNEYYKLFGAIPDGHKLPFHYSELKTRGVGTILRNFTRPGVSAESRKLNGAWTVKASGLEAVATLINTGQCVGFLPTHYIRAIPMRRPIVEVPGSEHLRHSLMSVAATERSRPRSLAAQLLLDIMKSQMSVDSHTSAADSSVLGG